MRRSPLFGRRIHIAGSVPDDLTVASTSNVDQARELVVGLVRELVRKGANFVVPVDAEKQRASDGKPVCFDWLVWDTIGSSLTRRPTDAPAPLAIAVQHHKSEEQVPERYEDLWEGLRGSDLVRIENASHWNMGSKRMEVQAQWGDVLVTIGGGEGVLFLANLYHDRGKPVVPLNSPVCAANSGSRRLFEFGLSSSQAPRLFRAEGQGAHAWINRINFPTRKPVPERVAEVMDLLEALEPPRAFAVRLLNPEHEDYADVDAFFEAVVRPVVEGEFGYRLSVVDGRQPYEHARIDQEIFAKLHRSQAVVADITGMRPNCFIELGYALGRGLPTMLTAKEGSKHPFDIDTFAGLHWKASGVIEERRRAFREHWEAIRSRPALVPSEPLIP